MTHTIYPCLWFDGKAKEAADHYCSIFKQSRILSENPMVVIFELNGSKFMGLNGGPMYQFSPANSYVIECDTQEEIDHYWAVLTADGGQEGPCGWLKDKFGVSWQIAPTILSELLTSDDASKVQRVTKAYLQMKKFDIQKLLDA